MGDKKLRHDMNAPLAISIAAIILSSISLIRPSRSSETVDQDQMRTAATEALRIREKELVSKFKPSFHPMIKELGFLPEGQDWNPETIEQLAAPLLEIIAEMAEQP